MENFDEAVLDLFLEKQGQLFPEQPVASTREEAEQFLTECVAVVVSSVEEVWNYFEEAGIDTDGADEEELLNAEEVFAIGDGRFLIVEV